MMNNTTSSKLDNDLNVVTSGTACFSGKANNESLPKNRSTMLVDEDRDDLIALSLILDEYDVKSAEVF